MPLAEGDDDEKESHIRWGHSSLLQSISMNALAIQDAKRKGASSMSNGKKRRGF